MNLPLLFLLLGILFIWLLILTILLWKATSHYNKLTSGATDKGLRPILDSLLRDASQNKKDIDFLKKYYDTIQREGSFHIQKVGLLRFNPFKDTGGDQSFILSLLDQNDTGVIISGLYSRSGTRWYAKKVEQGKAVDHGLSEDEKKAIRQSK
ncbi:MAG: DUF4446 family protein [Candidatus Levybacteria bacterium]|nr:DUF4446 family protein [Candidatus Levybacteria bacterium]MBI2420501.1 DUF4446 family protein [Candidatus Levybacteria bacterium]